MTTDHETTARSIVDQILDYDQLVSAIASALREAEAGEREACAKIADDYAKRAFASTHNQESAEAAGVAAKNLAASIRSRSETDE